MDLPEERETMYAFPAAAREGSHTEGFPPYNTTVGRRAPGRRAGERGMSMRRYVLPLYSLGQASSRDPATASGWRASFEAMAVMTTPSPRLPEPPVQQYQRVCTPHEKEVGRAAQQRWHRYVEPATSDSRHASGNSGRMPTTF